jgi:hypothetical protein
MSVWQHATQSALSTEEGELLLVSIALEPRRLEYLLETLARLPFPVNPQIFHDASVLYQYPDGREESETATLVEFPTYDVHLAEVREAISAAGLEPGSLHTINMLSELHGEPVAEPAPAGAKYLLRYRIKRRAAAR